MDCHVTEKSCAKIRAGLFYNFVAKWVNVKFKSKADDMVGFDGLFVRIGVHSGNLNCYHAAAEGKHFTVQTVAQILLLYFLIDTIVLLLFVLITCNHFLHGLHGRTARKLSLVDASS